MARQLCFLCSVIRFSHVSEGASVVGVGLSLVIVRRVTESRCHYRPSIFRVPFSLCEAFASILFIIALGSCSFAIAGGLLGWRVNRAAADGNRLAIVDIT